MKELEAMGWDLKRTWSELTQLQESSKSKYKESGNAIQELMLKNKSLTDIIHIKDEMINSFET